MKKIAIIGASYLQLPVIEKAKEMGIETHVFAWAANDVGELAADFFYPISIVEKEKILAVCKKIGIDGICSIASDLAVITVEYVAESMGLCCNGAETIRKCTNKHLMRQCFFSCSDPSPKSILADEYTDLSTLDFSFPVIVKPTDRSGSRGISKVVNKDELKKAIESAVSESFERKAVVEEFINGKEYSVEYISFHGRHFYLATTEKFTTGSPKFIETGHLEPASLDKDISDRIKAVVEHALNSLNIVNGASHTEVKVNAQGEIKIIEVGARMGGDCIGSDLVKYSTGIDFVKGVIQVALGQAPDLSVKYDPIKVKSIFLFSDDDLAEMARIENEEPGRIIRIADFHPELIGKATDSSNRAGCYILRM